MNSLCNQVGGVGKFWRAVMTKRSILSVEAYLCYPFTFLLRVRDTQKPRLAVDTRLSSVLSVDRIRDVSQVWKRIVARIAVNVVNLLFRKTASHVKPRQPVSKMTCRIKLNAPSGCVSATGNISRLHSATNGKQPSKNSGIRVVMQDFAQSFLRQWDNGFAHAVAPPKQWFGKWLHGVSALCNCA